MFKKNFFILLFLIILSAVSCTDNEIFTATESERPLAPPEEEPAEISEDGTSATPAPKDVWFNGYPMDARASTITWWIEEAPSAESSFYTGLSGALGVNVKWQYPPTGMDAGEAVRQLLAGGDYPDIMHGGFIPDAGRLIEKNIIRDLSEYIEEYSPNYFNWLQTDGNYRRAFKTDGQNYYGYGFFNEDGGWNDTSMGPVIRQDWLDAAGLPFPETISEWDAVLHVFKEKYNAVFTADWESYFKNGGNIAGAFGAFGGFAYNIYIDRDGNARLAQVQPEWINYAAQMNKWMADGLIDPYVTEADGITARGKAFSGETGLSFTSAEQLSIWEADARDSATGAIWTGLKYPTGDNGRLDMVPGGYGIGKGVSVISSGVTDDRLELVMRALDYAYSFPEGFGFWNFGESGAEGGFDANGNPVGVTGLPGIKGSYIRATLSVYLSGTQTAINANDLWYYPNREVTAYHTLPRGLNFTGDENGVRSYVNAAAPLFLTGELPLSEFNGFVKTIEGMGLDKVLEGYQQAYERYNRR